MSEGWIKLHRKLQDNPLWGAEPFTRGQAWVDLILLANHKPGFIFVRDHKIDLSRGDVGWSQNKLSERWSWSRTKVRKFLNTLEKEQQVRQIKSKSYTVIRLINYKDYQKKDDEKTTAEQEQDNSRTTAEQQEDTNKNVKNVKNEKKMGFIPPDSLLSINGFEPTWIDFEQHRKKIGAKLTDLACTRIFNTLKECDDPVGALDESIQNGWRGVFPKDKKQNSEVDYGKVFS